MRTLLTLSIVFLTALSSHAAFANTFCDKVIEPAEVENPTSEQLNESRNYSFVEAINRLYSGSRMRFKTPGELVQHQTLVAERIKEMTDFFGYSVTTEQVLSCSNNNSANIDFNLLRFAIYHGLKNYYSF